MIRQEVMIAEKITKTHVYFYGGIFSQWAYAPFIDPELGMEFRTAEHYMMYVKAKTFSDHIIMKSVMETQLPDVAKGLGKMVRGFERDKWNKVKLDIVTRGNLLKFQQNDGYGRLLLQTGNKTIVEGSPSDKIWGVGLMWSDPRILDESKWQGDNLLGVAIMDVRHKIRQDGEK